MRLVFAQAALDDLDSIWDYTESKWGSDRAERYTRDIHQTCDSLAIGTMNGRNASDIREGYWRQRSGRHVIFYRKDAEVLRVIRILHESMDLPARLAER